jgi:hypothetical protein
MKSKNIQHSTFNAQHPSAACIAPPLGVGGSMLNVECFPLLFLADTAPAPDAIGIFVLCAGVIIGLIASLISIASYFATRREVDDLKDRVVIIENLLEKRTEKLHRRINRLLAGQMLIAGKVGVALDKHQAQLEAKLHELESEED